MNQKFLSFLQHQLDVIFPGKVKEILAMPDSSDIKIRYDMILSSIYDVKERYADEPKRTNRVNLISASYSNAVTEQSNVIRDLIFSKLPISDLIIRNYNQAVRELNIWCALQKDFDAYYKLERSKKLLTSSMAESLSC